jgi:hypothetical protein
MYFVAVDSLTAPDMAVGVATSTDLIHWSALAKPLAATQRPTLQGHTSVVESPHAFKRNGRWWMPYTINRDQVFFETTGSVNPAELDTTKWTDPVWLRGVSEGRPAPLQYWHATEHLGSGSYEWLAAFNDNASSIDIMGVFPTDSAAVDSFLLDCPVKPPLAGVGDVGDPGAVRLVVTRLRWGTPEVGLRLELPARMPVRLAVYDVAGRRRATLLNRELPAGVTDARWNGSDDAGSRVASGVYFARLTCTEGARVSKLVMLR